MAKNSTSYATLFMRALLKPYNEDETIPTELDIIKSLRMDINKNNHVLGREDRQRNLHGEGSAVMEENTVEVKNG
jgi:hypothetical protein